MDNELKERIAKALFRRHVIDRAESDRQASGLSRLTDENRRSYDPYRHEVSERQVETSWAADGRGRAYWYLLAAEAIRAMEGGPLTELPKPLACEQCRGTGRVYVVTEKGLEPRVAKAQGKLALETCNACGGSGAAA